MDYYLVCIHPFGKYTKGQMITDPEEWAKLADDHEHHFVRIAIPPTVKEEPAAEEVKTEPAAESEDEAKPSRRSTRPSS